MKPIECYRGVVHPWMCDLMGHFTTRHYVGMFDDAAYHLFAAIGFGSSHIASRIGFADMKTTITYTAELHAGDLTLITGRVVKVGTKSLTLEYEMRNVETGAIAATMEAVTVQFDLDKRRAIEVLPEFRARIEALAGSA